MLQSFLLHIGGPPFSIGSNRFGATKQEVDSAEYALETGLKKMNFLIYKKLKKYKRQYIGYVDSNGHRILYINCLWKKAEFSSNWLQDVIVVCDGGLWFWQIKFDLTTDKLFEFYVNGVG